MQLKFCDAFVQLVKSTGKLTIMKQSYKFHPEAFQLFDISKCSRIPDERDML
jgi:hypothetical protein